MSKSHTIRIKNLYDLFIQTDTYIDYLNKKKIKFNENGYPVFKREMFLNEIPDFIVPYYQRNNKRVINKQRTVLCMFAPDRDIYPRLSNVFNEIEIYKNYFGVVSSDLTITDDMDIEWQKFILLLNQLFASVLAANKIKILFNTRNGNVDNIKYFQNIPKEIICVSGFLGCSKNDIYDYSYISKIMNLRPSKLLIYGKEDDVINNMLDTIGIDYKYYCDFHRICKKVGGKDYVRL